MMSTNGQLTRLLSGLHPSNPTRIHPKWIQKFKRHHWWQRRSMYMNLDEVLQGLAQEEVPTDINWNAPEPGSFPPAFKPGQQAFVFHLPEDTEKQFEIATIAGRKCLQCNFNVTVNVEGTDRKVMFQRANTFKTDKMDNSSIGNLIRSLEL